MEQKFCNFLGNGLYISNRSSDLKISPCCFYKSPTIITDIHTSVKNLDDKINLLLHDSSKKNYYTSACDICMQQEKSNIASYRQSSFAYQSYNDNKIVALTIDIDRKCNLACASCNENDSSLWYKEKQKFGIDMKTSIHEMHKNNTDEKLNLIIDAICKLDLSKVEWIKFGGGEPLLSNTHLYFLNKLKKHIDISRVTLNYTSNYSIVPSKATFNLWKQFKKIELSGSIDGVDDQFTFLRWPFKFQKLINNLKALYDQSPSNVEFKVEHTVNPLNIFYYDLFQKFIQNMFNTNSAGQHTVINIHPCWGDLGLAHTHPTVLEMTKLKLGNDHKVVRLAEQTIDHTKLDVTYLDSLDKMRGTNWRRLFCEVEKYYD